MLSFTELLVGVNAGELSVAVEARGAVLLMSSMMLLLLSVFGQKIPMWVGCWG